MCTKEEAMVEVLAPWLLTKKKVDLVKLLGKSAGVLWEETLPTISDDKYEFVDEAHYDFSDGTEAKTASVSSNPVGGKGNSYKGAITNVADYKGVYKTGDLRVAVYNAPAERVDFFLIPAEDIPKLSTDPFYTGKLAAIDFTYNLKKDTYGPKIAKYQVDLDTVAGV